jgi:hypothetical protein
MSPLYFVSNTTSDPTFESYLRDIHRHADYKTVKELLLPRLFESIEHFSNARHIRFACANRFEGRHPTLHIQCPVGFVPDTISIEFLVKLESFCVKQSGQEFNVQGFENLTHHLRVILVMGLAHWQPK